MIGAIASRKRASVGLGGRSDSSICRKIYCIGQITNPAPNQPPASTQQRVDLGERAIGEAECQVGR